MQDTPTATPEGNGESVTLSRGEFEALQQRIDALDGKLNKSEVDKARLEERVAAATKEPAPQEVPPPTREQLQQWVDNGQITEDQMVQEMRRQEMVAIQENAVTAAREEVKQSRHAEHVQTQFDSYVEANPDLNDESSDLFSKVMAEKKELMKLNMADSLETEVIAMRNVCGPIERVRETTRLRRQTHADSGGSGGSVADADAPAGKAWQKGLSAGQIAGFERGLLKGGYRSEDDSFFLRCVETARKQTAERAA